METTIRELDRYKRDLDLLAATSSLFNAPRDLTITVEKVVESLSEALDGLVCLFLFDPEKGHLVPLAIHHRDPELTARAFRLTRTYPMTLQDFATGHAFESGNDLILHDLADAPMFNARYVQELGIRSYLSVRIQSHGHMLGMLSLVGTKSGLRFDEQNLRVVRAIADQAANAISSAQFMEREVKLRQRAETLLKVAKAMRSDLDLPSVLQDAVDVTWQFLRPDFVGVFLLDETRHFTLVASTELGPNPASARWPAEGPDSFLNRTLQERVPVYLPQFHLETMTEPERAFFKPQDPVSVSAVPIFHQDNPTGMLVLLWRSPEYTHPEEDHELVVGIAELAGLAIENQRLIQREAASHSEKILAEEVAKEREALIRQIVHDLRNSTQAISLINEEIQLVAGEQSEIQFGVSAIDRQISFISNFLKEKISWIKQSHGQTAPRTTTIAPVLEGLTVPYAERFAEKDQVFAHDPAPEGIELPVSETQFADMIAPMLDNAHKFAPPGAHIKLWCALSDGWATLYVSDDGPCIPIDQQARIGEAGYRGRPEVPGDGQGLCTIKKLVNTAGGLFGFTSRPEAGNTFYVTLPTTRWGRPDAPGA